MIKCDKIAHFTICVLITLIVGLLLNNIWIGAIVGLAIGFAKEFFDMRKGGSGFSWLDILADACGVFTGIIFLLIL